MHAKLNAELRPRLAAVAVVPVLTITSTSEAVPLARALFAGGLELIEITLRTPSALDAIRAIRDEVPLAMVGAGTVLVPEHGEAAINAGARFLVSPGMTPRLMAASARWPVPFLPGAATASEAMALADLGFGCLKFFPAEQAGGVAALKALAAPLPEIAFCPTGGIDAAKARDYLALPNVVAVGGSWVAPAARVKEADWPAIERLAAEAAQLRKRR